MKDIQLTLAKIESLLVTTIRPSFLSVTEEKDNIPHILIVVSHPNFRYFSFQQRVSRIYSLLTNHLYDTIEERTVIVQAYDDTEMGEIIEGYHISHE